MVMKKLGHIGLLVCLALGACGGDPPQAEPCDCSLGSNCYDFFDLRWVDKANYFFDPQNNQAIDPIANQPFEFRWTGEWAIEQQGAGGLDSTEQFFNETVLKSNGEQISFDNQGVQPLFPNTTYDITVPVQGLEPGDYVFMVTIDVHDDQLECGPGLVEANEVKVELHIAELPTASPTLNIGTTTDEPSTTPTATSTIAIDAGGRAVSTPASEQLTEGEDEDEEEEDPEPTPRPTRAPEPTDTPSSSAPGG